MAAIPESFHSRWLDLLTCCSDAPERTHRAKASLLLARELVARLALQSREHGRTRDGIPWDPAYEYVRGTSNGGPRAAKFFLYRYSEKPWAGTLPKAAQVAETYAAELAAIETEASDLSSAVAATMPIGSFSQSRERFEDFLDYFLGDAMHPSKGATEAWFGLRGAALPLGFERHLDHYIIEMRLPYIAGYRVIGNAIIVPQAGTYRVRIGGRAKSSSGTDPADIKVRVDADGVQAHVSTFQRNDGEPETHVEVVIDEEIEIEEMMVVRNGSSPELNPVVPRQWAAAGIRVELIDS